MLSQLSIKNVAVIEQADVEFSAGLNVLTGETGAGKSILIDSINAILGGRTSRELVRSGAAKAAVWASFTQLPDAVCRYLEEAGYEAGPELLLQREIGADGRGSCRVNGRPATVSILRKIGTQLITIHGQQDNQSLLDPARHLGILDDYAQNGPLLAQYTAAYQRLRELRKQRSALLMDEGEKQRRMDLLRYQAEEIEAAGLQEGEEEQLQAQRTRIHHAQKILNCLGAAYAALQGGDEQRGGVELLGEASDRLEEISGLSEEYAALAQQLADLYYTGQDLASELNSALESWELDPAQLDEIEERLDLLYRLKSKYGPTVAQVLEFGRTARQELETIEFSAQRAEQLQQEETLAEKEAAALAQQLTEARKSAFERFGSEIERSLRFLNMPGIRFSLRCDRLPLAASGQDGLEFYISANRGEAPKPLAKIASGGELSRIMLAIKSVMAEKDQIPTVIYDEIDAGVSGLAAGRIGQKLKETAGSGHQVICITHTAQIAAYAAAHLLIEKKEQGARTYTSVLPLAGEERVQELARIISGDKVTEISLANAREMLQLAGG